MRQPELSVIIPIRNAERYLAKCIDSLLTQTYTDFELILVENSSTDGSAALCRTYAAVSGGGIRLLELPAAGVSAARNAGIEAARGRFLTFIDADDWVEPDYLAEFFRDTQLDAGTIVLQGLLYDTSEHPSPRPSHSLFPMADTQIKVGSPDEETAVAQQFLKDGYTAGKIYPAEMIRRYNVRFPKEVSFHEDHVFFFCCLEHADRIVWRKGCGMHYMCRDNASLSSCRHSATQLIDSALKLEEMLPDLLLRFSITDPQKIFSIYDHVVISVLIDAARSISREDYMPTLRTIMAHKEVFSHAFHRSCNLLTPTVWRMLRLLPEWCYRLIFYQMALRRLSLSLRGRA